MSASNLNPSDIEEIIQRALRTYNAAHGIVQGSSEEVMQNISEETPSAEVIPQNSSSVLVSEATSRFNGAMWYNKITESSVTLAGVGGIGSYVAFLLARMNIHCLNIYDDDVVERANMSGQLYGSNAVGYKKVDAVAAFVSTMADFHNIIAIDSKFTKTSQATDIMICGFDNMAARRTFFESWKAHIDSLAEEDRSKCLFIDGRLAAEEFQVFTLCGNDSYSIDKYERDALFKDSQAEETLCSYKQTSFCANMIGSVMVNIFVNFIANLCEPLIPRDVPYLTRYSGPELFFKVVQ